MLVMQSATVRCPNLSHDRCRYFHIAATWLFPHLMCQECGCPASCRTALHSPHPRTTSSCSSASSSSSSSCGISSPVESQSQNTDLPESIDSELLQGRRHRFRPGWANICLIKFGAKRRKKFFRLPTLVFSLPTLPYVAVAHPAHPGTLVPTESVER